MKRFIKNSAALALAALLSACGGSSSSSNTSSTPAPTPTTTMEYMVTVSNLTHGQPLSPVAVVLHQTGNIYQVGEAASNVLEQLAESGDNTGVLGANVSLGSGTNGGILMPGMMAEIMVSTTSTSAGKLSLATMLVNTNDAFSGLNGVDISHLSVGDSMMVNAFIYDAGTEANSEMAGTIPGPADGGQGYDAARDDVNYVAMHPGVVSYEDGLGESVLNNSHKFDNPGLRVMIVRTQ